MGNLAALLLVCAAPQVAADDPGLVAEYFAFDRLGDLPVIKPGMKPVVARVEKSVNYGETNDGFAGTPLRDNFYVRWTGNLAVPKDGTWTFQLTSDDGSRLFIDGACVVDHGGLHGMGPKSAAAELKAGRHAIRVEFFESGGGAGCILEWRPPGGKMTPVPANALTHPRGAEKRIAVDAKAFKRLAKGARSGWSHPMKGDYGPFFTASFALTPNARFDNGTGDFQGEGEVARGIALKLADDWSAGVIFDADTCRIAAGWIDGGVSWRGVIFDGAHGPSPTLTAEPLFRTPPGPGWAKAGRFEDPREDSIPPLPRPGRLPTAWAKYRGLYLNGNRVILSYTVGDMKVLESAAREGGAIARILEAGPSKAPHTLMISAGGVDVKGVALPPGARIVKGGTVTLELPPRDAASVFKLLVGESGDSPPPEPLSPLTRGGAARWTEPVTTKGVVSTEKAAYVVDRLTVPYTNPWNSRMRIGAMDFFSDGTRAAVSTWNGDVWIVGGIDADLDTLTWKRFATGLFQPLGLRIVDDTVYTVGHDQITRLRDLDGDGEADFYECFNNDWELTTAFHAFCFDLQTDPSGNFYFAFNSPVRSGGGHFHRMTRHHGCILRVSPDGERMDVYATGFRANNGIGVGPHGEVTSGDNEGTWVPKCPIHWVREGSFNGVVSSAHREMKSTDRSPDPGEMPHPICWLPKNVDNSGGGQAWVTGTKWGPFEGRLLHTSYGQSSLFLVMMEEVSGRRQGGVVKFPVRFTSSAMRPRFNPGDGQLYVAGLKGWQSNASREGGFDRVRYTGAPVHMPTGLHVRKTGVEIAFTGKLDPETANDPGSYAVSVWNYRWTSSYGSGIYSADPSAKGQQRKGGDALEITSAKLSDDGRSVFLEIPKIRPVMQMQIRLNLRAADATPIRTAVYNTIHEPGG